MEDKETIKRLVKRINMFEKRAKHGKARKARNAAMTEELTEDDPSTPKNLVM